MFDTLRKINLLCLILCCALLGAAFYLQFIRGLEPCPLCVIQRLAVLGLFFAFFFGSLYTHTHPLSLRLHSGSIIFITAIGMVAALRQIWLQNLPADQLPASCGPDLSYILQNFPMLRALELIFEGTGECAKVNWEFLDLTIPEWTLIFFLLFAGVGIFQLFKNKFSIT
jgi:protein dithiol:quinone oxidoreductase